jgi:hypothetical protein
MIKLKKKTKPLSPHELANEIFKLSADQEGLSLKEYRKVHAVRTRSALRYAKTHWVKDLTHAQKHFIATTTDVPHTYMGLPLSKGNAHQLENFKHLNVNYLNWVKKNNNFMKKLKLSIASSVEATAPLAKVIARNKEAMASYNVMRSKLTKSYQKLGKQLRFNQPQNEMIRKQNEARGIMSLIPANSPQIQTGYLLNQANKENKIAVSNGLNSYMRDSKLKRPLDIPEHYLSTYENPKKADYVVDSYDNPVALAEGIGITPQRLFIMVCNEVKKSKKLYERIDFERPSNNAMAVEELLNLFDSRVASTKATKYTQTMFFNSKDRKTWSEKYNYNWENYKRFNEDFKGWNKTFKARASQREDSDADMFATFADEIKRGK